MIRVGLVGTGFLSEIRARCYAQLRASSGSLDGVVSREERNARAFAERHEIGRVFGDFEEMLGCDEIDVVDLCVPNGLHRPMTIAAAAAGKHIICTKPLTAYLGQDLSGDNSAVATVDPGTMLSVANDEAKAMVDAAARAGVQLCYGENWIYAPAIRRAAELVRASGGRLLEMRGWEAHSGSHSPYAKEWRHSGGGALLRLGAHPIGAMLWLKYHEGLALDGAPVFPVSVVADVANLAASDGLHAGNTRIADGWVDVENWGVCAISFADGSRGVAYGSDNLLGGMQSRLELNGSNFHFDANMSPNDMLRAYAPDASVFGDEYMMEKADTSAGWTTPMPDEMWTSGQAGMLQAFFDDIAAGQASASDGHLGAAVTQIVYAAYLSAREGRRVPIDPPGAN